MRFVWCILLSSAFLVGCPTAGSDRPETAQEAEQAIKSAMKEMHMYGIENLNLAQLRDLTCKTKKSKITLEDAREIASFRDKITRYLGADPSFPIPSDEQGIKKQLEKEYKSLKKLYRAYALLYHPDRHKKENKAAAEKKFKRITHAFEVLTKKLPEYLKQVQSVVLEYQAYYEKMFQTNLDEWIPGFSEEIDLGISDLDISDFEISDIDISDIDEEEEEKKTEPHLLFDMNPQDKQPFDFQNKKEEEKIRNFHLQYEVFERMYYKKIQDARSNKAKIIVNEKPCYLRDQNKKIIGVQAGKVETKAPKKNKSKCPTFGFFSKSSSKKSENAHSFESAPCAKPLLNQPICGYESYTNQDELMQEAQYGNNHAPVPDLNDNEQCLLM